MVITRCFESLWVFSQKRTYLCVMAETNYCPSRHCERSKEFLWFARESGFSLLISREKIARYERVNKRERERIRTNTGAIKRTGCRLQIRESERVSELYWERLDAVWPSVTTRLRRSPEHWPFGSLKGLYIPKVTYWDSLYASASRLRFSSRSHPRVWIPLKTRKRDTIKIARFIYVEI